MIQKLSTNNFYLDFTSELASTRAGTTLYRAPEVLRNNSITRKPEYNKKVDVWSLGVCGYEMISFDQPFTDELVCKSCRVLKLTRLANNEEVH